MPCERPNSATNAGSSALAAKRCIANSSAMPDSVSAKLPRPVRAKPMRPASQPDPIMPSTESPPTTPKLVAACSGDSPTAIRNATSCRVTMYIANDVNMNTVQRPRNSGRRIAARRSCTSARSVVAVAAASVARGRVMRPHGSSATSSASSARPLPSVRYALRHPSVCTRNCAAGTTISEPQPRPVYAMPIAVDRRRSYQRPSRFAAGIMPSVDSAMPPPTPTST